jgi:hypothetical protein
MVIDIATQIPKRLPVVSRYGLRGNSLRKKLRIRFIG